MKLTAIFFILIFCISIFSQTNEEKVKYIQNYADSIDNAINNSSGYPGELFCNTVTVKRNERAIGLQETKISYYFLQKEDSVVDNGGEVKFYPVYDTPVKISVEYNIAASQHVKISYYFYNNFIYYTYRSKGEYGYDEKKYVIAESDIKYSAKYDAEGKSPVEEKYKDFTKEDFMQSGTIYSNYLGYEKLYYQTFNAGQLDK